jgi:pyruvyl transferase EpsO
MIEVSFSKAAVTLAHLKAQLASILELFDPQSRIFYVDYPVHSNIGDLLINLGTEQFFLDHHVPIHRRYSVMDMPQIAASEVDGSTTFLCHGGGNFGDLYPKHQLFRECLLDRFPQARIVFLPQSLHYTSPRAQLSSFEKIAKHQNCHILVRDRESLLTLQSVGISHCSLMPDMAHHLWQTLRPARGAVHRREMHFLRQDAEATCAPSEKLEVFVHHSVDWNRVVSIRNQLLAGGVYWTLKMFGHRLPQHFNTSMWYMARDRMIADSVTFFSDYERIYTNRLHAMLLALLLGRDVTAFDNSYGKLSRYITTWLAAVQPET